MIEMDFSNLLGILPLLLIIALLLGAVAAAYSGKSVLKTIVFCAVGIILIGSLLVPALSISSTDSQVKDGNLTIIVQLTQLTRMELSRS